MRKILKIINTEVFLVIILILISLGSVYYLLLPGFYEPQDLHHIADIYEMYRAIISGQLPPRMGPDFFYSFGYPLFNFYYVGPFYLGALVYLISGSLRFSYESIFVISVLTGGVGFYLFLRNHFSKIAAFAATILFTYTPYKAVQIYVRGAMGELLSLSLMPLYLYFIERSTLTNKKKWFVLSVLLGSFLIISHNYFWVLIFGFGGAYFLLNGYLSKKYDSFKRYLISLLFSIGMTAYWWIPALSEQKILNTRTPFPLVDHFPFIKQLLIPSWGYGASLWGPHDGMSFQLGVVNIFVVLIAIILIILCRKKPLPIVAIWSALFFVVCLIFMNIRSYFVWRLVPFYNLFQFPWRLLSFTGFFSSILSALIIDRLFSEKKKHWAKIVAAMIIFFSIYLTVHYFKPSKIFYKSDNDYLNRMFAGRTVEGSKTDVSQEYVNYSEDYLLLPKWMEEKPGFLPNAKFEAENPDAIDINSIREITPVKWEAQIKVKNGGILNFYSLYFPGWVAYVDGRITDIQPGVDGQITLYVEDGVHTVLVKWTETNIRKFSDLVSILTFVILIVYAVSKKRKALP